MVNTGGPAFPRPHSEHTPRFAAESSEDLAQIGMMLRDYFAAKAMHAELATAGAKLVAARALIASAREAGRPIEEQIAVNAYRVADAMVKVRDQEP